MGRNKYSQSEIDGIAKLLRLKNAANRARQKEIRHQLRTQYEFNISPDFVIVSPKILHQRVWRFSDALPSTWFGCKPPCSELA